MIRYTFMLGCLMVSSLPLFDCVAWSQNGIGQGGQSGTQIPGSGTGTGAGFGTGTTNGTGSNTSGNTGTASPGLSADAAFSGIQRGDSIGSTANSGASFSNLSSTGGGALGGQSGLGGFGAGGLGGFGGFGNAFGNNQFNQSSEQPTLRTRIRSAIVIPPRSQTTVAGNVQRTFYSSPAAVRMEHVGITIEGTTAIVSGTVATEQDRRMSELLLRLEPGIRQVDNRVIVSPPSP